MTPDEASARLRAAIAGLPAGWTMAATGPAKAFALRVEVAPPPDDQLEFEMYYYGPSDVFDAAGNFDPRSALRSDPFVVAAAAPAGRAEDLADLARALGVTPTVVTVGETDVVAATPAVADEDVETFVAFIAGANA